jgi:hypothetical protein
MSSCVKINELTVAVKTDLVDPDAAFGFPLAVGVNTYWLPFMTSKSTTAIVFFGTFNFMTAPGRKAA